MIWIPILGTEQQLTLDRRKLKDQNTGHPDTEKLTGLLAASIIIVLILGLTGLPTNSVN